MDIGDAIISADKVGNWWMLHANGAMEAGSALTMAPVGYTAPLINPIGFNAGPYFKSDTTPAFPIGDFSFVTVVTIPSTVATSVDLLSKFDGSNLSFTLELNTTYTRFYVKSASGTLAAADLGGPLIAGTYIFGGRYNSSSGLISLHITGLGTATATATGGGVFASSVAHTHGANAVGGAVAPAGWLSYGTFVTEKQLTDADIDRIGAMSSGPNVNSLKVAKPRAFWPITIDGTNDGLKVNDGASDHTVNIAHNTYSTLESLLTAFQTVLNAAMAGMTVTVDYTTGLISFNWTGPFTVKFADAASTAIGWCGSFAVNKGSTDDGTGIGAHYHVVNTFQHANGWYGDCAVQSDSLTIRDRTSNTVTRAMTGQAQYLQEAEVQNRIIVLSWLKAWKTYTAFEDGNLTMNQALEHLWDSGFAQFKYYPDQTTTANVATLQLDLDCMRKYQPTRQYVKKALYSVTLACMVYQA